MEFLSRTIHTFFPLQGFLFFFLFSILLLGLEGGNDVNQKVNLMEENVKNVASSATKLDPDLVRCIALNIRKGATLCIEYDSTEQKGV